MTENEAIARFKSCQENVGRCEKCRFHSCCGIYDMEDEAIRALEEVQQYRKIGTVEECRTAREKQMPKKPDFTEDKEFALCPCCNGKGLLNKQKYCDNCGQKLDWSDEDDEIN